MTPFQGIDPDSIIAAYGESCSGPGWSNSPIVFVTQDHGKLATHYVQPGEQTAEMAALFAVSAAANGSMMRAVRSAIYADTKRGSA